MPDAPADLQPVPQQGGPEPDAPDDDLCETLADAALEVLSGDFARGTAVMELVDDEDDEDNEYGDGIEEILDFY